MKAKINIIEEITEKGFENSLIVTFNCSLVFYENLILKQLLNNNCSNNIILMDYKQYDDLIINEGHKVQYCGSYYICERIRVNGAFHPKIILLTGKDLGKLLIGSGNTTFFGYGKNFELFYKFEYSNEKEEYLYLFQQVISYIEELHKKFNISQNPAFSIRSKFIKDSTPWLNRKSVSGGEKFIHNIDMPIIEQIFNAVPKDTKEIVVAAPFFGNRLEVINTYKKKYPNSKITILTQSGNTNFPVEYYFKNPKLLSGVSLHKISSTIVDDRSFHAKFIYMTNGKSQVFFSGSPNQTSAALESSGKSGNLEAGILLTAKNKKADFDAIWKPLVDVKKVSKQQELLKREFGEQVALGKTYLIRVLGAYLHNFQLRVRYESGVVGAGELILNGNSVSKIKLEKSGEIITNIDPRNKNNNCIVVQIKAKGSESNLLWVSNTFIKKIDTRSPITKQVNSLSRYIADQSYIQWLVELSPNLVLRESATQDIIRGISLTDQEEAGEKRELPEEQFFVEEKPDYYSLLQKVGTPETYAYGNDLFTDILNGLLHAIGRTTLVDGPKTRGGIDQTHNKDEPPIATIDEKEDKTVYEKISRKIDRLISRVLKNVSQVDNLDLNTTINLSQFLAALIWFLDGIKLRIEEDEEYTVSIDAQKYLEASVAVLSRLWVNTSLNDYLEKKKEEIDYQLLELTNIYPLSLCLITFNMQALMISGKFVEEILLLQKNLLDVFWRIRANVKKMPKKYLQNILSDEKTSKITARLKILGEFNSVNLEKLIESEIDRTQLEEDLAISNSIYFRQLLEKKKLELNKLEKELDSAQNELKRVMYSRRHILDSYIAESNLERIRKEHEDVSKLISNLSSVSEPSSNKLMCKKEIRDFFSLV